MNTAWIGIQYCNYENTMLVTYYVQDLDKERFETIGRALEIILLISMVRDKL